jgi:hypothetical protein
VTVPASSPRGPGCASDLDLDELLAGDLAGAPREATLRAHVDACARCRERMAAFAAVEPPQASTILPQVMRAGAAPSRRARWRVAVAVMTAGAAVAALLLRTGVGPGVDERGGDRTKGGLALTVFVKRAGGAVDAVGAEGALRPGDEMRFSVATVRPGYAVVLGLDASPSVTIYAPAGGGPQPIRLDSAGTTTLPGSIVADETAGAERVVAVVCEVPTPPEALRARGLAALTAAAGDPERVSSLGTGCAESGLLLRKEPRAR